MIFVNFNFIYILRLRCNWRTHVCRSFHSTEEIYITPLNDQIERREIQLVKWRHVTRQNMDLPEGSTSTTKSSPLPLMQRPRTVKWVCHSTALYIPTLKFVPAMRNMLWTKEMHHTSTLFALYCEKLETCEKSTHPKGIFLRKCHVCN